jgi:5-methylcytosine-specific restriction endonuclease McrA
VNWLIRNDSAWFKIGEHRYRHYCGAEVEKRGSLWTSKTESGALLHGHKTARDAIIGLVESDDPSFWYFGQFVHESHEFGNIELGGVLHKIRPISSGEEDEVFAFCLLKSSGFPEFLKSLLNEHFLGKSTCVRCSLPMTELLRRDVRYLDGRLVEHESYLICACGYPVWQMERNLYSSARDQMNRNTGSWRRMQRLRAAGGKHSPEEIQEILAFQKRRCLYCNSRFTDACRPSKDHLLPVTEGGTNSALNIVLACKSCNSSRGSIPFRTFCKLLSPAQNRRILEQLRIRLSTLATGGVSEEGFRCFVKGLAMHDPKHFRYCDIQRMRTTAHRNAKTNRLLPGNVKAILRDAPGELKRLELHL